MTCKWCLFEFLVEVQLLAYITKTLKLGLKHFVIMMNMDVQRICFCFSNVLKINVKRQYLNKFDNIGFIFNNWQENLNILQN